MQNSTEIQVSLNETTAKLADLRVQRVQFERDLAQAAHDESVAVDRVRLRLDDAESIAGPRNRVANLRPILGDVEADIAKTEAELADQKIALAHAQRVEKMASAASRAADAAHKFNEARSALAVHLESAFATLQEYHKDWERARSDFSAHAGAHGAVNPAFADPNDVSLGTGAYRQRVANARATVNELEGLKIDTTHVIGALAGFNELGKPGSGRLPANTGSNEHRFYGLVNRAFTEMAPQRSHDDIMRIAGGK